MHQTVRAASADEVRPVSEEELAARAAQIMVIVPPEYPAAALGDGIEATVDVYGTVRVDGHLAVNRLNVTRNQPAAASAGNGPRRRSPIAAVPRRRHSGCSRSTRRCSALKPAA